MNVKDRWADAIIRFNSSLQFDDELPKGIRIMNPYRSNPDAATASQAFYRKYYNDRHPRTLILGINPGRLGAGHTGIPFTDTSRLQSECGISWGGKASHEPSSVFVYDVIRAFGGPGKFYGNFYISSISPLGFVKQNTRGEVNYNYYDDLQLQETMRPWMRDRLVEQLSFGINREQAICFGTGKNYKFIDAMNREFGFFDRLIPLEHPRYIMQYKSSSRESYVTKYLEALDNSSRPL